MAFVVIRRFKTDLAIPSLFDPMRSDLDFATCSIKELQFYRKRGILTKRGKSLSP